jgi:hypothetical protein
MIPYLIICQLGIWLLPLLTFINGFSEIMEQFGIGLSIIMGGLALTGKTHCSCNALVYSTTWDSYKFAKISHMGCCSAFCMFDVWIIL